MPNGEPPGGGGTFSNLPPWVKYAGGAVLVVGGFLFYRARKNAQAAANQSSTQSGLTSGAQAGAYGSPLPGSGMLQPILIQQPISATITGTDGSTTPTTPTPAPPATPPPSAPQTPAPMPAAVPPNFAPSPSQMIPGEKIVQEVFDQFTGGWLDLTNLGGVYTSPGQPFYGSYLGYAATTPNPAAERAGRGNFTQIIPTSSGYTLVDQKGETYNFGPSTPKSQGGTA